MQGGNAVDVAEEVRALLVALLGLFEEVELPLDKVQIMVQEYFRLIIALQILQQLRSLHKSVLSQ